MSENEVTSTQPTYTPKRTSYEAKLMRELDRQEAANYTFDLLPFDEANEEKPTV